MMKHALMVCGLGEVDSNLNLPIKPLINPVEMQIIHVHMNQMSSNKGK